MGVDSTGASPGPDLRLPWGTDTQIPAEDPSETPMYTGPEGMGGPDLLTATRLV